MLWFTLISSPALTCLQAHSLPVGIFQRLVLVLSTAIPLPTYADRSRAHSQNQVCMPVAWQDCFEGLLTILLFLEALYFWSL